LEGCIWGKSGKAKDKGFAFHALGWEEGDPLGFGLGEKKTLGKTSDTQLKKAKSDLQSRRSPTAKKNAKKGEQGVVKQQYRVGVSKG